MLKSTLNDTISTGTESAPSEEGVPFDDSQLVAITDRFKHTCRYTLILPSKNDFHKAGVPVAAYVRRRRQSSFESDLVPTHSDITKLARSVQVR